MSQKRLNKLYADLDFLEFELSYLHDSLNNYYSKRQKHWTPQYRRIQIEDIRSVIPTVYEDITNIKKEIDEELDLLYSNNDYYNDDYDYNQGKKENQQQRKHQDYLNYLEENY